MNDDLTTRKPVIQGRSNLATSRDNITSTSELALIVAALRAILAKAFMRRKRRAEISFGRPPMPPIKGMNRRPTIRPSGRNDVTKSPTLTPFFPDADKRNGGRHRDLPRRRIRRGSRWKKKGVKWPSGCARHGIVGVVLRLSLRRREESTTGPTGRREAAIRTRSQWAASGASIRNAWASWASPRAGISLRRRRPCSTRRSGRRSDRTTKQSARFCGARLPGHYARWRSRPSRLAESICWARRL